MCFFSEIQFYNDNFYLNIRPITYVISKTQQTNFTTSTKFAVGFLYL